MKLSYDFDIEDLNSFQRFHYSVSPTYRRMRRYVRFLFPAAALFFIVTHYLRQGFDPLYVGIFGSVAIVWFVLYPRFFDRRIIRRSNQLVREGNTGGMFGPCEIELLPDRVHITSSSGETSYRASAITKVVETTDLLLLYVSSIHALVLPRRKLSPRDFQQATAFAQQYYANNAA